MSQQRASIQKKASIPLRIIAARVARRLAWRLARNPLMIVLTATLLAVWFLAPAGGTPASSTASDSAEQYFQALRDRNAGAFVDALSPQARRTLEVRFGLSLSGAVTALFREQEARGDQVVGWEQVSRYRTVQGDELRFYVVHYTRGDDRRDVPYTLTVGADGKIEQVE
jgi:hypothetical protein